MEPVLFAEETQDLQRFFLRLQYLCFLPRLTTISDSREKSLQVWTRDFHSLVLPEQKGRWLLSMKLVLSLF